MKIGFIGLGAMGMPMAASLLRAGHELTVYNRTPAKAEPLVRQGAQLASQIADACRGEAVITMLSDDNPLRSVCFGDSGILAHLRRGGVHISCSTVSVAIAEELSSAHHTRGQSFVCAPVFGRPQAAADAKLFLATAGESSVLDACAPIFNALGQKTFRFGEKPWLANLVKLSGNFLIASVIESLSEAMALVAKAGLNQSEYLDFLTSTLFNAPVYKTYGNLIVEKKFQPAGFTALLALKDVRLAIAAAEHARAPLPIASLIHDRLLSLLANGGEALDWSAISRLSAEAAGI